MVSWAQIDELRRYLRNEFRIKENINYSLMSVNSELIITCMVVYHETIADTCRHLGIAVKFWFIYEG